MWRRSTNFVTEEKRQGTANFGSANFWLLFIWFFCGLREATHFDAFLLTFGSVCGRAFCFVSTNASRVVSVLPL